MSTSQRPCTGNWLLGILLFAPRQLVSRRSRSAAPLLPLEERLAHTPPSPLQRRNPSIPPFRFPSAAIRIVPGTPAAPWRPCAVTASESCCAARRIHWATTPLATGKRAKPAAVSNRRLGPLCFRWRTASVVSCLYVLYFRTLLSLLWRSAVSFSWPLSACSKKKLHIPYCFS